jgi:ankyrin repeat protein
MHIENHHSGLAPVGEIIPTTPSAEEEPRLLERLRTALHNAIEAGNVEEVSILLEHHVDPNAADFHGHTALMLAAKNDCVRAIQMLLAAGADINMKDKAGRNAIDHAKYNRRELALKLLTSVSISPSSKSLTSSSRKDVASQVFRGRAATIVVSPTATAKPSIRNGCTIS